ncbi:MAG: NAD(P)/FAD-dependent oxidoreductase [Bdellovibrionaceae bacterium]|nr:NAD(P)/FAD-dependent oxidoreductase [Pseudobdellovibrionaceae bacterium]
MTTESTTSPASEKCDVLLLGSGISSLTAGLLLAKQKKSVIILEQHTKVGGYLHCFERFGEKFDTGAHYIGSVEPGQAFHSLLNFLGIWDPKDYVPLDTQGFDELHGPHFHFSVPKGYSAFETSLIEQFPQERQGILDLSQRLQTAVQYFSTYKFNDFLPEHFPEEIFDRSLASVVETLITDPRLRQIIYMYCTHHGASPQTVSFGFHAVIIDTLLSGAYGFAEGGEKLAARYKAEIEKHGGKILTKHKVSQLETDGKNIRKVHTENGKSFEAEWVISSLHPRTTFDLVDDTSALTPLFRSRIKNLKEGPSFFGIYALLKNDGRFKENKNYFFLNTDSPDLFSKTPTLESPPFLIFMSAARRIKNLDSPHFPVNIHALAPYEWFEQWSETKYGRRPQDYKDLKKQITELLFSVIETHAPGFRDSVIKYETSSPLSHLHFNGSFQGSAYGIDHGMNQSGPRAIGPRTKILNLLLTGQNSLFPGLLGSAVAGLRTAGHIVGIKHMLQDLKNFPQENQTQLPTEVQT